MKNKLFSAIILAALICAGSYFLFFQKKPVFVPYRTFYSEVSDGKISEATISSDKINFKYNRFFHRKPGFPAPETISSIK